MNSTEVTERRLCIIGDELVAGSGDPKALGWVGRVAARTQGNGITTTYALAVPGETTTELAARWEAETLRRFATSTVIDRRLVVALGRADVAANLSLARSRLNLANILDVATELQLTPLVVGPPPGNDADNARLADLASAFADVAGRRRVPFVDLFAPLRSHEQWLGDLAQSGNSLPGQAGYGLIAWLVLHSGWHRWLGLPDDIA